MRQLSIVPAIAILLGALGSYAEPRSSPSPLDREIDKLISLYADGFASSDKKARHIIFGPLFGKGRKDAVVFFSLFGVDNSNAYLEYVAVFAAGQGRDFSSQGGAKERPYHLIATAIIGNRLGRTLDWKTAKIAEGRITIRGLRWAEGDAGCCPTSPTQVTLTVANNLIDEIRPDRYPVLRENENSSPP